MFASFEWWIDALWRNGLALVPVALLAWLAVQLMARRPATRHVIWLGALSWLAIGLLLPPLPTASDHSENVTLRNERIASASEEFFVDSSLAERHHPVEHAERSRQDRIHPVEFVSYDAALHSDWEHDWQRSESLLTTNICLDAKASERNDNITVRVEALTSIERAQDPTPPTTIARSSRQPSHVSSSMVGSVGQSSPTIQKPVTAKSLSVKPCEEPASGDKTRFAHKTTSPRANENELLPVANLPNSVNATIRAATLPLNDNAAAVDHIKPVASPLHDDAPSTGWLATLQKPFDPAVALVQNWSNQLSALPRLPWQLWLTLTIVIIAWRSLASIRFTRSLKRARPAPHAVQSLVDECADLIGLRCAPTAHLVGQRVSPLILCYPRPRLIIPEELWAELDADSRRVVILHELAHLKRRDHWTHWFNELLGALYWWHPLVWWMRRRIADEAENACDMWVTWLAPKSRRAYATALIQTQQFLTTKQYTPTPASAVGILSPQAQRIARRLTMIMTHRNTPRSSSFGFLCVPALLLAAWVTVPAHSQTAVSVSPAPDADEFVVAEVPDATSVVVARTGSGQVVVAPKSPAAPAVAVAVYDDHDHEDEHDHAHAHAGGGRAHKVRRTSHDENERMARLEAQLARLTEQVEHLSASLNQRAARLPQPAPGLHLKEPKDWRAAASPLTPQPTAALYANQHQLTRRYQLPDGKREALNNLMKRSDVPVLMRPRPDGIELIGTAEQHEVFERFVLMLGGKGMDHTKTYKIDPAQMEDLRTLMVRDDVPVLVAPDDDRITVHGNELIQKTFKDFIDMIAPKDGQRTSLRSTAPGAWPSAYANARLPGALKAKEAAERAQREAQVAREYASVRAHLRKAQEQVKRRARDLEAKADQMQARADALREHYEEVKAARQQANADRRIVELDQKLAELRAAQADIEAQAAELYDAAAEAEAEIEELDDEMDELADG